MKLMVCTASKSNKFELFLLDYGVICLDALCYKPLHQYHLAVHVDVMQATARVKFKKERT